MDDNCCSKGKNRRGDFRNPLYIIKRGPYTSRFRDPFPSNLTRKNRKKGGKRKQ